MNKPLLRFLLTAPLAGTFAALSHASDVIVSADFNIGQGIYYSTDTNCRVITPKHVIGSASSANIMLPTREYFKATPEHSFDIDIAVLSTDIPLPKCQQNSLLRVSELEKLLGVYQEGVLKTRLADGSVLQTQVTIDNVGEEEFLSIKPTNAEDTLKQGYSGSVLYVAEQAAGVLLEVDEQGGIVYRSDALAEKLDSYFVVNEETAPEATEELSETAGSSDSPTTNSHFKERLATNQVKPFKIDMQENSPVEFILTAMPANEMKFEIAIMDKRENVFYKEQFWSSRGYKFAFTPPDSQTYTVRLKGLRNFGELDLQLKDFAFDAELRGRGNVLAVPGTLKTKIARNALANFTFKAEKNSPILFNLPEQEREFEYSIRILDSAQKSLWYDEFWSSRNYAFAYTPQSSGELTVQIEGHQHYGTVTANIEQWNTDRALSGAQNVVEAGDVIDNKLARNAVAEYRMMMTKNAPIDFKFDKVEREMEFLVQIIDETGKVRYSEDYWSTRENRFVFTPLSSDVHIIRITGEQHHGNFRLKLFDYD